MLINQKSNHNKEANNLLSKSSKKLKDKQILISVKEQNKVVLALLFLSSSLLFSIVSFFALLLINFIYANREFIYVEQLDGTTKEAQKQDRNFRSDEVIKNTVTTWLYLTWEWDSRLPGSEQSDPGIKIGEDFKRLRIPTKTYVASYLLEEGFRQQFLLQIAKIIPDSIYSDRSSYTTSNLIIYHVGIPRRIESNIYEIDLIFTRIDLQGEREIEQTKSSKTFVLKTIEPHQLVLKEDEKSAFRRQLNELLKNGLLITDIKNYQSP